MNLAIELNRILALCGGQPKDLELMELYREVEEEMTVTICECGLARCYHEGSDHALAYRKQRRRLEEK